MRKWEEKEKEIAIALIKEGKNFYEIAEVLNRTIRSVERFLYKNGYKLSLYNKGYIAARNKNIQKGMYKFYSNKAYTYTCEKCAKDFITNKRIRKERKKHCEECKRHVTHFSKDLDTINLFDLSTRTISKILNRLKSKCSLCGWDEASLDVHHIIFTSNGGDNSDNNLVILCPNCHRKVHNKKIDIEVLKLNTIKILYSNWRDYYAQRNC